MKKGILIALIVLVVAALVISPLLKGDGGKESSETMAVFLFKENLQLRLGDDVSIGIVIPEEKINAVRVMMEDRELTKFNNPASGDSLYFQLRTKDFKIGTKRINLISVLADGSTRTDSRFIRILSDIIPDKLGVEVVTTYPHNTQSFTQGLEFYKGKLFESTGLLGKSMIAEVDLPTGVHKEGMTYGLDGTHFGEGITILNGIIYQLTWQNQKCLTYELSDKITPKGEFYYTGEGWGLTNDGSALIMSNGTEFLTLRNPTTFQVIRTLEVYNDLGPVTALNELEFFDGLIWANIWQQNKVVAIDPESGKVIKEVDASALVVAGKGIQGEVLNGIAVNRENGKIYMTGKNWERLLEVRFVAK